MKLCPPTSRNRYSNNRVKIQARLERPKTSRENGLTPISLHITLLGSHTSNIGVITKAMIFLQWERETTDYWLIRHSNVRKNSSGKKNQARDIILTKLLGLLLDGIAEGPEAWEV